MQYPNIRIVGAKHRAPFFRYQMPATTRITLILLSLMALAILIPALIAVGFFLYAFLGAALIIAVLANQVVARRATRSRTRADGVPARTTDAKAGVDR